MQFTYFPKTPKLSVFEKYDEYLGLLVQICKCLNTKSKKQNEEGVITELYIPKKWYCQFSFLFLFFECLFFFFF
jgi:hypothetical protein